jgi:plasmid stabilization system protein ParE
LKAYTVIITEAAEADLRAIHDYIAARGGAGIAFGFIERIESYCLGFAHTPERGTRRDDLRPGLRTVGFRRRATILFEVRHGETQVVIHGVYYAGRSFEDEPDEG